MCKCFTYYWLHKNNCVQYENNRLNVSGVSVFVVQGRFRFLFGLFILLFTNDYLAFRRYRKIKFKSYFGFSRKITVHLYFTYSPRTFPRRRLFGSGYLCHSISVIPPLRDAYRVRPFCANLHYGRDNKNNDRLYHDGHGRQRAMPTTAAPSPKIVCRLFTRHVPPRPYVSSGTSVFYRQIIIIIMYALYRLNSQRLFWFRELRGRLNVIPVLRTIWFVVISRDFCRHVDLFCRQFLHRYENYRIISVSTTSVVTSFCTFRT